jgi:glycosyltransferase involved in cell wall biosynthesis
VNHTKVAYIQGRPGAHPMHRKFAETVNAKFHFVDFRMRWQDKNKSILYRMISWFICALTFPSKKSYGIFLVDNLHFMPVLMKSLRLIRKKQKIVAHMGSHTLYFIYAHRFSKPVEYIHIQALKRYDALICEGKMAETLVKEILGDAAPKTYTVINGIPEEHFPKQINLTLKNKNILFIGHGTGKERMWYKGLDLMVEAFAIAKEKDTELTFTIVGEWDKDLQKELIKKYNPETQKSVNFVDETPQLDKYINNSSLYLHCARGEAYGLTILIAMSYGLPTLVSEWTGAKEVVEQIDKNFVVPIDAKDIAAKINWYFSLNISDKEAYSTKFREIGCTYTEKKALDDFNDKFLQLEKDFGFI